MALTLLTPLVTAPVLRVSVPKRIEPWAVGFVAPPEARVGRGFALGMLVEARGCGHDVDVTVVAAGTAEFWHDHTRLPSSARFRIALPDARPGRVEIGLGRSASDVTLPQDASLDGQARRQLTLTSQRTDGELLVVTGTVRNWSATLAPIIAHYRSDWLERRGLGTCYLRLPALTGELAVLSAQRARRRADRLGALLVGPSDILVYSERVRREAIYNPELETAHGAVSVDARDGDVLAGDSAPPPDSTTNGLPTWTCQGRPKSVGSVLGRSGRGTPDLVVGTAPERSAGALSRAAIDEVHAGNCGALAVIAEPSAGYRRDLVMLATGTLVSLGFTMLLSLFRRPRATARDGPVQ